MKVGEFNSLLLGLNHKIQHFDLRTMLDKIQTKELSKEQVQKLKDSVITLQEDLMVIDCSTKRTTY